MGTKNRQSKRLAETPIPGRSRRTSDRIGIDGSVIESENFPEWVLSLRGLRVLIDIDPASSKERQK